MEPEEFIGRARELVPVLRERAARAEELRRLPDETRKDLLESGLLRGLQPRAYGGSEVDPGTFYRAVAEVGRGCGSTAWVLGIVGVHNWQLPLFPGRAQEEVWGGDPSVQISSSYAPTGQVERVAGGFRVRGRWSFSTGCDLCEWVFLGGVTTRADDPSVPEMRTFLIPRRDYRIDDNWNVVGLCGTGSKDIVVEDAFVPEYRTHSMDDGFRCESPGNALHTGPNYRLPFGAVFAQALVGPAVGAAQGALECFEEQTLARHSALDFARAAESPIVQLRLAEAATEVSAARAELTRSIDEMLALARTGSPIPLELRARHRWEGARAVARCVNVVSSLFHAAGGRVVYRLNPLQRFFRDVHAMQAHAVNHPESAALLYGRTRLGQPSPRDRLL